MNKKQLFFMPFFVIVFLLSACVNLPSIRVKQLEQVVDRDNKLSNMYVNNILSALNKKDAIEFKNLFSKNAVGKIEDIDDRIAFLFDYYNGDFVSHSEPDAPASHESSEGVLQIISDFTIETSNDSFFVIFEVTTSDSADANNVGINMLQIYNQQDIEDRVSYGFDNVELYIPGYDKQG